MNSTQTYDVVGMTCDRDLQEHVVLGIAACGDLLINGHGFTPQQQQRNENRRGNS